MKISRLVVPGVLALAATLPSGAAHADEAHHGSDNGHRITLVSIGQIDDPMEDVLEHVAVLGHNQVVGS
ncbi:hypothetical protein E2C00_14760 [Streptomyces sp. WAC05374]|uniref:hypothetical protein n=1 Tax=Streptomyces sp. WAC05374 TaxID=2487420 RepID=UPI000F87237D|nr:hypothetical protein [Streptomyces sp. WAC05374]RST18710.1 hypothetical protein EF905_04440 [Streptomyces sp. WAC05374]TDF48335.1 hypothetical protein E2B92_05485 [Streptomyces sp. WAC05374]TDF49211.1 hypothetical protein E2C02_27025 [Streptomyces sp. WAC05374]TDF55269.1 hypothetical protein E2C00_14760 [Streptomyces sp. WAC05374]